MTLHLDRNTWTESEYLAIGETPERIELFNGNLVVITEPVVVTIDPADLLPPR